MFEFNAPIGYSKNPLNVASPQPPKIHDAPSLIPQSSKASIDQLPLDVLVRILSFSDQLDVLSLAYTNKFMAKSCLPTLYETVIVDSSYTPFNKEHSAGATFINSLFYFKKFIKTYSGKYPTKNFYVVGLPDLFNVYDVQMSIAIARFFSKLDHLNELVWLLDGFRLEYLQQICSHSIRKIEINTHHSMNTKEYFDPIPIQSFPCLKVLSLIPVATLTRLAQLLRHFLREPSIRLSSLALSKFDSKLATLVPTAEELSTADNVDTTHRADFETDTLATILKTVRPQALSRLTTLCLGHMLVCIDDAKLLAKSVDLTQITTLSLSHVSEYETEETRLDDYGFLGNIGPLLIKLKDLHLDFRETQRDTIGSFLGCVASLKSLDLVVRMNEVKQAYVDVDIMHLQYIAALDRHKSLKKLSLEFREESNNCDVVANVPMCYVTNFHKFSELQSLRLSSGGEFHKKRLIELLQALPNLMYLDDYGTNAGGAPNLGLGMVHPTIFDEWYKVQHIAMLYHKAQPRIQYARIKKYVFEFEGYEANPRSGIESWFDEQVRVLSKAS